MDGRPARGMTCESHEIVIVGAGQGGLSVSYFLRRAGIEHLVVDRAETAGAWSRRWDSFCLVTPNWTVRLPGAQYAGAEPDGFMRRDEFVRYMRSWADGFGAPVRSGVEVTRIAEARTARRRFRIETSAGALAADAVVVATATYQTPRVPALARRLPPGVKQLHADSYRAPGQAEPGAVLVVGSGQTGCQVAEDFLRDGREVFLSVGRSGRLPRRYRGRDCLCWQAEMGTLDRTPDMLASPADRFLGDPHLTGRDGGASVSLYGFHRRGVRLLGRLRSVTGGTLGLDARLPESVFAADRFAAEVRESIDSHIARTGGSARPARAEPGDDDWPADEPVPTTPTVDLAASGIRTVVWATGFLHDFSWIEFPVTDSTGYPVTVGGSTRVPGLFFCGLNWMTRRKSGILYGVGEDARRVSAAVAQATGRSRQAVAISEAD